MVRCSHAIECVFHTVFVTTYLVLRPPPGSSISTAHATSAAFCHRLWVSWTRIAAERFDSILALSYNARRRRKPWCCIGIALSLTDSIYRDGPALDDI